MAIRTSASRPPGDDPHRADFGPHRAARNRWIVREHRLDLRTLAHVKHANAKQIVANPGWPRHDKAPLFVHPPQVLPVRLKHLQLFFDPISRWPKDDEKTHAENLAPSPQRSAGLGQCSGMTFEPSRGFVLCGGGGGEAVAVEAEEVRAVTVV
jgi:hypothetical protein